MKLFKFFLFDFMFSLLLQWYSYEKFQQLLSKGPTLSIHWKSLIAKTWVRKITVECGIKASLNTIKGEFARYQHLWSSILGNLDKDSMSALKHVGRDVWSLNRGYISFQYRTIVGGSKTLCVIWQNIAMHFFWCTLHVHRLVILIGFPGTSRCNK